MRRGAKNGNAQAVEVEKGLLFCGQSRRYLVKTQLEI
jgi:hypothetical protein